MEQSSQTANETRSGGVSGKTIAIIAYLTLIGLIIAYVLNNNQRDSFANFHIRQSLGLALAGLALGILGMVPILGWIVSFIGSIVLVVLWVRGLLNAINGKEKPVPALGKYFEEWFQNL